jgi:Flp pilus assembly protein TadG
MDSRTNAETYLNSERFRRDERGSVAIIFALTLPVALALTGAAVVFPLAQAERAKLSACVDHAALAGAVAQSEINSCTAYEANNPPSDPQYQWCVANVPNINPAADAQAYAHANQCDSATITIGGNGVTVDASSSASGFGMIIPVSSHAKARSSPLPVALVE